MSTVVLGAGLCLSQTSIGSTIDRPHFNVDGVAIVWAADAGGTAPIVSDFIIDSGGADTDLINGDVHTVITGSLTPTDNAFPDGTGATLRIQNSPGGGNQTTRQGDRFTSAALMCSTRSGWAQTPTFAPFAATS